MVSMRSMEVSCLSCAPSLYFECKAPPGEQGYNAHLGSWRLDADL